MSRRTKVKIAAVAGLVLAAFVVPQAPADAAEVQVIVEAAPGAVASAADAVEALGGEIVRDLPIIDGFAAVLDEQAAEILASHPAVLRVTPDGTVTMLDDEWGDEFDDDHYVAPLSTDAEQQIGAELSAIDASAGSAGFDTTAAAVEDVLGDGGVPSGHMLAVTTSLGARAYWEAGFDGSGVDVAIIDTGIAPVPGMTVDGKVVNGADLSFESQIDELRHLDSYGHGTHLAAIIAGRDSGAAADPYAGPDVFLGMAPGARLINVKVAGADGVVDVSQVIAAIDWVVQHRTDNGMNIRVLNLSFGTDGTQSATLDPLAHAVEVAWTEGIVVVVAAGNDGKAGLRNPALDPLVITVGAVDNAGTNDPSDDVVPEFSSCATSRGGRRPDVLAPGKSILSLRVPQGSADQEHPEARVGDRLFKGSGTSQSAAVVSGAVALIIDQYPAATPDQVKGLLMKTASPVQGAGSYCAGYGVIDLFTTLDITAAALDPVWQRPQAAGTGSLELARGSMHLEHDGVVLVDEQDIFGNKYHADEQAALRADGASWSGGDWNGATWTGASWSGTSWSGASWSGASWSGASWSTGAWTGASWSGASWSGASWSGASWSGVSWSGASWSGQAWAGLSWN